MSGTTDLLDLGSDLALRYRYFTRESLAHPAKLHLGLLAHLIERYTRPGETIADPMAGIGSTAYAALLQRNVVLREIEPRWLTLTHENAARIIDAGGMFAGTINISQADARERWDFTADHLIFSPPYAVETRRAEWSPGRIERYQELARSSRRWRYLLDQAVTAGAWGSLMFDYGRHPAQLGHLRGDRYWAAMEQIYRQARAVLPPPGRMILVIKDHIRDGQRVCIADETAARCEALGFQLIDRLARRVWPLSLWQRRRKEQGKPIVEEEDILVFTTGERI